MSKRAGAIASYAVAVFLMSVIILNLACYVTVLAKMRSVERKLRLGPTHNSSADQSGSTKYHGVARIMMLFVFVYILQYWALCIFSVWGIFAEPSVVIIWFAVFCSNMGACSIWLLTRLYARDSKA